MKKILKMTLFKKIFFIILSGFMFVEGFHIYLDYKENIYNQVRFLSGDKEMELLNSFYEITDDEEKNMQEKEVIKMYHNTIGKTNGYHAIYNKKNELIYEEFQNGIENEQLYLYVGNSNSTYIIETSLLSQEEIDKMHNLVKKHYSEKPEEGIVVEISGEEKVSSITEVSAYSTIYPQYLSINNNVIIDTDHIQNKQTYLLTTFQSQLLDYKNYSSTGKATLIDYDIIKKQCQDSIYNSKEYGSQGMITIDYQIVDKNLYVIKSGYIDGDERFIHVSYMLDVTDILLESAILTKGNLYSMAFVLAVFMSIFISYMITSRIKRIDQMTEAIASHDFEVKLKETPRDELGNLSKNINHMSLQLEKTIKQLNEEINHVKELESLRKDFINQFTHEMKTPLGIINGYSELIDETDNDEEREKYLTIINRETTRINQLIQSMLSLSRLESGKVELKKEDFDLEDSVTGIIDEYEVLLMKKNIQVKVNTIQPCIYADQEFMETVIHNFLSNAIKHAYENSNIIITIHQGISVYNEGKPILEERLENIWYTFVTHDKEGSGLGLAICRSILELHGFKYGIINKDNGVEFYFKDEL